MDRLGQPYGDGMGTEHRSFAWPIPDATPAVTEVRHPRSSGANAVGEPIRTAEPDPGQYDRDCQTGPPQEIPLSSAISPVIELRTQSPLERSIHADRTGRAKKLSVYTLDTRTKQRRNLLVAR